MYVYNYLHALRGGGGQGITEVQNNADPLPNKSMVTVLEDGLQPLGVRVGGSMQSKGTAAGT